MLQNSLCIAKFHTYIYSMHTQNPLEVEVMYSHDEALILV